jgi:cell wall-associated NlpC family hydrolase
LVLVALVANTTPASGDAIADKKAEAERIARQLEQQSRQVSILAEDYDAARVKIEKLQGELDAAAAEVAHTDAEAGAVRSRLKDQSVEAYMRGGAAPALALLADTKTTEDIAVRSHYVRTITSGTADTLDELRVVRLELDVQRERLDAARAEARDAAELAESKKKEATAAAAAQQQTLRQVQGELAVLVEAEAKRRAEEEARRVQAELAAKKARAEAAAKEAAAKEAAARELASREAARRAATTTAPRTANATAPDVTVRPSTTSTTSRTTTTTTPSGGGDATGGPPAAGADAAVAEARRQLGKPYEWGGGGPDSFDCSGLTSFAWRAGGKTLSHSSRAQWSETSRVSVEHLQPGDILFYGDPIHHVGIFVGDGQMIEAPETGKVVRVATIYRSDLVGAGRVN